MTQVLNFAVSDFQVLVGSLDITNALSGFGASHNAAEVGEPLIWSGTLQLTNPLPPYQLAESLDNLINPGRWAKGAHPVKLYINGSLFLTLRILDYSYDPDAQTAEATLTDKLGLVKASGGTKDKPLEGFAPSAQVPLTGKPIINRYSWTDVAKAIATQGSTIRNQTIINPSDIVVPSPNGATYSTPPYVRRDTVAQLANIASASANSWVWCDKNEQIRFVTYPKLGLLPFYRLSRKQVEDFKRLPPDPNDEVTAVEIEGEGTGIMEIPEKELDPNDLAKLINPALNDDENEPPTIDPEDSQFQVLITPGVSYPIVIESPKTGGLLKRQTIFNPLVGGSSVIRREETLGRIDTIIPDSTDTAFIVGEEVYAEEYYSSKEGKLLTRRIVKVEPLGKIAPEVFPKETARITSDDTNEEWYYNLDGTPIERFVTTKKPACVVFKGKKYGTGRIIAQKISETWVKLSGDVTGAKYQHQVLTYKTKGELYPDKYPGDATLVLIPDNPEPEIVDAQPQPIYQETRTPIEIKTPTKEKEFDNAGDTEGTETETTITLTDVPDDGDALDEVAQTAGDIRRQRIGAHEISHPLRSEDLLNYQPFRVVDVHTGRFVRDEFGIALGDDKELSCFYTGNLMGAIAAVPDPPTNLLIEDGGSTTIFVTQGVTISPIKLRSGEGVAPYTYDASGLPDGVTLTGNEISGTPTGTGSTSATVTVTDGASNSYSYLLNFDSSVAPVALAHYRQIMRFKGEVQHQSIWQVVEPPRTEEIVPVSSIAEYQGFWQIDPPIFRIEVEALAQWSITSVAYAPIGVQQQGEWKVEPLYFRNYYQSEGIWEINQIAQFIYPIAQTKWYLNPTYAPIQVNHDGDWSVIEVLPPSAEGHIYTVSQSSILFEESIYEATYAKLTDSDLSTGASTYGNGTINVDFGEPVVVASVTVAAGSWGAVSASSTADSLANSNIYYSTDNSSWSLASAVGAIAANQSKTITVANIIAQYWRLQCVAEATRTQTAEFRFT